MLHLIEQHTNKYSRHTLNDRLKQGRLTLSGYQRLRNGQVARTVRESAIPEEDVKAVMEFIAKYPEAGAGKIHLSL
ncbi:MAG: hypothetical protein GY807_19630, partial [Gammaproteobacteria bacterium]|nr:hypothetical protein [Gammaproteobacteria bacterium]